MTRTFAPLTALILLAAAAPLAAQTPPDEEAERALERAAFFAIQGDEYRAVTQYKLFLLSEPFGPRAAAARVRIAWLYQQAERHRAAAVALGEAARFAEPGAPIGFWAPVYIADAALAAGRGDAAERGYREATARCEADEACPGEVKSAARFGLAKLAAREHDFERVASVLTEIPGPQAERARSIAARLTSIEIPSKSPALAGALSIVPGLGHLYIEEYSSALVAAIWNGAFIYAFVDSIVAERYGQATLIGLVESVWYGGTIFGAVAGAHRFNRDARRIVEEGVAADIDAARAEPPWPARFRLERAPLQLRWGTSF